MSQVSNNKPWWQKKKFGCIKNKCRSVSKALAFQSDLWRKLVEIFCFEWILCEIRADASSYLNEVILELFMHRLLCVCNKCVYVQAVVIAMNISTSHIIRVNDAEFELLEIDDICQFPSINAIIAEFRLRYSITIFLWKCAESCV